MSLLSERWSLRDGIYRDSALEAAGVVHGVTSRPLGDMKSPAARMDALRRAGLPQAEPITLKQVHGNRVAVAGRETGEGDGLVSRVSGQVLAVWVADCLPVFLWDPRKKVVGIAHSGWRGTKAGVAAETLRAMMSEFGTSPRDVVAAIGPHVRDCCYVVSPETAAFFPESAQIETEKGPALDLGRAVHKQLQGMGVAAIHISETCTASSPETLFSFRRDKSDARMMAFIACP